MRKLTRRFFATMGVFFEDYFPQGWRFFLLQYQNLIVGIWDKNERQPFWFANLFGTLLMLPAAIQWGMICANQGFWWVIGVVVICHFVYSAIMMTQEWTISYFWMFAQDVSGRFFWLIPHVALITLAIKWLRALIF